MPTYEYRCRDCGHSFDIVQKMSDDQLTHCPECGGELRKVFTAPAISFKGSGFYATDHGKKGKQAKTGGEGGGEKKDSSSSDTKKSERRRATSGPRPHRSRLIVVVEHHEEGGIGRDERRDRGLRGLRLLRIPGGSAGGDLDTPYGAPSAP